MKSDDSSSRRKRARPASAAAQSQSAKTAPPVPARINPARRWLFRVLAMTLAPVLLLGLVEIGFRVAGYGHPVSFFLPATIQGQRMLVENDKFGWRFFPPELARSAAPTVIRAQKETGTFRIFLFGESAALGDPRPAYGMGRYLLALLQERYPAGRFEVVPVAMTAINSHAFPLIARECAKLGGDAWIVYAGHNEMMGPFGASSVFGLQTPPTWFVRGSLALQATRAGQWLTALARRRSQPRTNGVEWAGMKMFRDSQLAPDDPKRAAVHRHFEQNLSRLVKTGLDAGAKVILCTTTSNLRDCPPFASLHGPSWLPASAATWTNQLAAAVEAQSAGHEDLARSTLAGVLTADPQHAEAQFRMARLSENSTNASAALRHYELARDCDALPFRADAALNSAVTRLAAANAPRGVLYLDTFPLLATAGEAGIPGRESFFEHVHLTPEGNYRIARGLAEQVAPLLPAAWREKATANWADQPACNRWLALTVWNRAGVLTSMLQRLADEPFTTQLDHAARLRGLALQLREARSDMQSNAVASARQIYEDAVRRAPADFRLHENFGEFLEGTGQTREALAEWQKIRDLTPHHLLGHYQVGRLHRRLNQHAEAEASLRETLKLRPDLNDARLELAACLAGQGRPKEALAECREALRLHPGDARAHLDLAQLLAAQKERPEAIVELREAIRLKPSYWEARYYLGVELAVDGNYEAAEKEFAEVTRLRPDFVLAHLNLGVALAKQGRLGDALGQFEETLRLDSNNAAARQQLQLLRALQPAKP